MAGVLYVLSNAAQTLCKIGAVGRATSIQRRLRAASFAYRVQFFLYAEVETGGDPFWIEGAVHRTLRKFSFRPVGLIRNRGPRELFQVRPDWARDAVVEAVEAEQAVRLGEAMKSAERRHKTGRFMQGDGFIMF